ncbi:nucleoid occlusion protein Noc [Gottschalkia purinilytica]|uniref:Nucleoid occlusion protein Noc n=1 Tax=Gottschalkia purinilytica TaxID=1503 RepID=A0A0L0W7J9_GOTPU|nr:ParB/RepB/Spo0J family partition protein [Gottschalkia purinilytica]KNF07285.1 nucleoid occlusion protein Noc [Gottschalkia purinilytica]
MSIKKRGLGKGLSALIPSNSLEDMAIDENEKSVVDIDINLIEPNCSQPRKEFNEESLNELSESIKRHGVIQPIILRKKENGYEIIAGERRWRASNIAGIKKIPSIIKNIEQLEATEISLIENIQRENLNIIEEAMALKSLIEKYNLTQEEVANAIGKSRPYITNTIRLLNLQDEIIDLILKGKLSSGHGRALLAIEDKEIQNKIAQIVIEKNLSVRETEKIIKEINNKNDNNIKKEKTKDPIILEIEESLRRTLGTKVHIVTGKKKGKIEIEYYDDEHLERILDLLSKS